MSFELMLSNFKAKVLDVAIHNRMQVALDAGIAAARAAANVKTGNMKSLIGGIYSQETRTLTLYGDAKYTSFQNSGFRNARTGRLVAGHHFMEAGLAAMVRTWGGNLEVQFPTLDKKYHERTIAFQKGKIGKAKVVVGHKQVRSNSNHNRNRNRNR